MDSISRSILKPLAGLMACAGVLAPVGARGDIYKWVDEKGVTVYSNVRPADSAGVKEFRVAIADLKRPPAPAGEAAPTAADMARRQALEAAQRQALEAAQRQAAEAAQLEAMRREQFLQDRLANLERQVQMQQYATALPAPAPVDYYATPYPSYAMPYSGFAPSFGYPWGYGVAYVVPTRFFTPSSGLHRPAFAAPRIGSPMGISHRTGFSSSGRGRR